MIFAALCALSALAAGGAVTGVIRTDTGVEHKGVMRWSSRDKAYVVTKGNFEIQVKGDEVAEVEVPKPEGFDAAVAQVNKGQGAAAAPVLQKIVKEYTRFNWDKAAGRYLAEAYIAMEKPEEALKVCDGIIRDDPSAAYKGDLVPAYWSALLGANRRSTLTKNVERALKGKDRFSRGAALLMTGDMAMKDGNDSADACKKALIDGYLRVALLYTEPEVAERLRPEALYKAASCFDKLNQSGRADAMRTELKASYASSPWANK